MSHTTAKRKVAELHSDVHVPTKDSANIELVKPGSDLQAILSPANGLRASLEQALEGGWNANHHMDEVAVSKIPFAWTLTGMSIVCAAFWYTLAALIF
jgi:hypothetical protein